jgi:drug/metabolite transporter (DMT)-like permease
VPIPSIAALIALASAVAWGGGDFCGGMGVKAAGGSTTSALRFVVLAHTISLAVLLAILTALHQPIQWGAPAVWALTGGVAGGLGLTTFYIALSRSTKDNPMGAAAALSGLLAAAIPAVLSSVLEGAPRVLTLAGFVMAAAAIWMIAADGPGENGSAGSSRSTLVLAALGGVGFGLYYVALRFANPLGLIVPMALARAGSLLALLPLLGVLTFSAARDSTKQILRSAQDDNFEESSLLPWMLGVALLDTGGNMLFVAATRLGRLDVAAVLGSLYPAATILLAAWHLHERPTRRQLAGMAAALAAVVMITV